MKSIETTYDTYGTFPKKIPILFRLRSDREASFKVAYKEFSNIKEVQKSIE